MRLLALATMIALTAGTAHAADNAKAEAQALDLAKRAIAFRSVSGPGNQTPQLAAYLKSQLVAGGFKDSDVNPDVTVSLSALSDFVVYGQRGYSYMQL